MVSDFCGETNWWVTAVNQHYRKDWNDRLNFVSSPRRLHSLLVCQNSVQSTLQIIFSILYRDLVYLRRAKTTSVDKNQNSRIRISRTQETQEIDEVCIKSRHQFHSTTGLFFSLMYPAAQRSTGLASIARCWALVPETRTAKLMKSSLNLFATQRRWRVGYSYQQLKCKSGIPPFRAIVLLIRFERQYTIFPLSQCILANDLIHYGTKLLISYHSESHNVYSSMFITTGAMEDKIVSQESGQTKTRTIRTGIIDHTLIEANFSGKHITRWRRETSIKCRGSQANSQTLQFGTVRSLDNEFDSMR